MNPIPVIRSSRLFNFGQGYKVTEAAWLRLAHNSDCLVKAIDYHQKPVDPKRPVLMQALPDAPHLGKVIVTQHLAHNGVNFEIVSRLSSNLVLIRVRRELIAHFFTPIPSGIGLFNTSLEMVMSLSFRQDCQQRHAAVSA